MLRPIVGFRLDDDRHHVAHLSCGHGQHMRHQPPMTSRPWVLTVEGRERMLGTEVDCVRCDRREIPEGFVEHRRTQVFNADTVPTGLLRDHQTCRGVWGKIEISVGRLRYVIDRLGWQQELTPSEVGIVLPEVKHHIAIIDASAPLAFHVAFYSPPPTDQG